MGVVSQRPGITSNPSNSNGSSPNSMSWESNYSDTITATAFTVVILFTVCGSLLILLSIARSKNIKLRCTTQCYTVSLALGNLLMAAVVMPVRIISFLNKPHWISRTELCEVYSSAFVFCCTVTVLSLAAMSLDRFFSIPRSARYQKFLTKGRVLAINLCLWLFAAVVSFAPAEFNSHKVINKPISLDCKLNRVYSRAFVYVFVIIEVLIPVLLMLVVHCRISKATINHMCSVDIVGRKVKNLDYSDVPTLMQEASWAKVVIKIIFSFIIFWIPRCIFLLLDNSQHSSIHEIVDGTTEILTYSFGASLALLLAYCSNDYKDEMMEMVCPFTWFQRRQHKRQYTVSSASRRVGPHTELSPMSMYRKYSNNSTKSLDSQL